MGLLSDRPANQQQALPTPFTQQPATTASVSPKPVITVPVRPTLPEPVLPSVTQQPASAPIKTPSDHERSGWPSSPVFPPAEATPKALPQPAQPPKLLLCLPSIVIYPRLWLTLTVENGGVLVQCTPTFIGSSKNYKSRQLKSSLQLITGAIPQKNQALGTLVSPQNA